MLPREAELEVFKKSINLVEFAASEFGFEIDRRKSTKQHVVMRSGSAKIVITRNSSTGHWTYREATPDATKDKGTVIDLVQERTGKNIAEVRKLLRPWIGQGPEPTRRVEIPQEFRSGVGESQFDRETVQDALRTMKRADRHLYLEKRGIGPVTLHNRRFQGCIWSDRYHNAIFPHRDREGACGYEIKNDGFTGFAKQGRKGLWLSNTFPDDTTLVISETAIDAISYAILHESASTRYMSTGGTWNEFTPDLLKGAAQKIPGKKVVLAYDNDAAGESFVNATKELLADVEGLELVVDLPVKKKSDWNEILSGSTRSM